jgi:steroid delta-isomerase-like uncharacterized protein
MSLEANQQLAIALIHQVVDREDFELADRILSPDFASYFPSSAQAMDRESLKHFIQSFHAAFPDSHHEIEETLCIADRIVVRYTARGTHQGVYLGIPPTGRKVTITAISIYRVRDNQIVEEYAEGDLLGLMTQLEATDQ